MYTPRLLAILERIRLAGLLMDGVWREDDKVIPGSSLFPLFDSITPLHLLDRIGALGLFGFSTRNAWA